MLTTDTHVYCSQCGQALNPSEVATLAGATVCANCKPTDLRKLQEGAPGAATLRYKGFWIRWLAKLLDWILIDVVLSPLYLAYVFPALLALNVTPGRPATPAAIVAFFGRIAVYELVGMTIFVAYNTLMLGRWGTTMGKMAISAKVVASDGTPIGYGRALGRTLMELVSGMALLLGYIIAAFDDQKRTLHDRVAGTVVVAKP